MLIMKTYSSSEGVLGANLAEGQVWQKSSRRRRIVRMGLIGGSNACDSAVDVFYGTQKIAHLENFHTSGLGKDHLLWHSSKVVCYPNTPINVIVTDAFPSNVTLVLDIQEY